MKKIVKKVIIWVLVLALGFSAMDYGCITVKAETNQEPRSDNPDKNGDDTDGTEEERASITFHSDGTVIEIINGEPISVASDGNGHRITQSDDNSEAIPFVIDIDGGTHEIIIEQLHITGEDAADSAPAISIGNDAVVNLTIRNENVLKGGIGNPAISVEKGSKLFIRNEGILKVFGGSEAEDENDEGGFSTVEGTGGDGIGSSADEPCGEISINGGVTYACAGNGGTSIKGLPQFHDSAFVYINDSILPSESSDGYILYTNSIFQNGNLAEDGNSYVSGYVVLEENLMVPQDTAMTIQENSAFTISGNIKLSINGMLKNEGIIVNNGTIDIAGNGSLIHNGTLVYSNGNIQNEGKIYVFSSILKNKITGNGEVIYPEAVTVTPKAGLWKYYGQEKEFNANEYSLSENIATSGWHLSTSSEEVGTHNYVIEVDDISGSMNGKVVLAGNAPTFEIKQYKTSAEVDKDSKWYNKADVDVEAPEGYLISTGKEPSGQWNWDESATVTGLNEGENTINYYLRSNLNDVTKDAIDTTRKSHSIKVDTIAPGINKVDIEEESVRDTLAEYTINANEGGTYYYIVLLADAADDLVSFSNEEVERKVKAGQGICGSSPLDGNKDTVIRITGLVAETEYKVYAVVKDKAGNLSEIAESGEFTTSKSAMKGNVNITGTAAYGNTVMAIPTVSTPNAGELSYSWYRAWDFDDETDLEPIENAGSKTYKITQEDLGSHLFVRVEGENCSGYITGNTPMIPKLQPAYTVPVVSARTFDPKMKLSKINLPEGWAWETPNTVPSVGTKKYAAVYTPNDDSIYDSVTKEIQITVKAKKLSKDMIRNLKGKQYEETAVVSDLYLIYQKVKLEQGKDYTISYKNNKSLGIATVTMKGKKNYTGTLKTTFEIKKKDVKNLRFTCNSQSIHTGMPLYPRVTVRNGKTKLKRNKDYVVEYKNNTRIGIGKIVIKGIGNYKGTQTLTFTITPSKPSITRKGKGTASFTIGYHAKYGAENYEISYSAKKSFPKDKTKIFNTKSNSMAIANLDKKTTYYVRVRAYSKVSRNKIYGPYSKVMEIEL